jgi:hypothetical protein
MDECPQAALNRGSHLLMQFPDRQATLADGSSAFAAGVPLPGKHDGGGARGTGMTMTEARARRSAALNLAPAHEPRDGGRAAAAELSPAAAVSRRAATVSNRRRRTVRMRSAGARGR